MTNPKRRKATLLWFLALIVLLIAYLVFSTVFAEKPAPGSGQSDFTFQTLLRTEDIMTLCEQGDVIWAGGKNGVFRIGKSDLTAVKIHFKRSVTYVKSICVDNKGAVWVGFDGGLLVYDGDQSVYYNRSNGLPDNRVNAVYRDGTGTMWIGTWGGLAIYKNDAWSI